MSPCSSASKNFGAIAAPSTRHTHWRAHLLYQTVANLLRCGPAQRSTQRIIPGTAMVAWASEIGPVLTDRKTHMRTEQVTADNATLPAARQPRTSVGRNPLCQSSALW